MKTSAFHTAITAKLNRNFALRVNTDAAFMQNQTGTIELRYPADMLIATSFSFGPGWQDTKTEHNLMDNANGTVVKTAAYPERITALTHFGVITFIAKKQGKGTILIKGGLIRLTTKVPVTVKG